MKDKIIFLDIDGVLNSEHYFKSLNIEEMSIDEKKSLRESMWGTIDPKCYLCFVNAVKKVNADIVISSSWRDPSSSTFLCNSKSINEFYLALKKQEIDIVGATPRWSDFASQKDKDDYNTSSTRSDDYSSTHIFGREAEIYRWIKDNNFLGKWCAIDDDTYDMYHIQKSGQLIQTSWYSVTYKCTGGFCDEQSNKLISFFSS